MMCKNFRHWATYIE